MVPAVKKGIVSSTFFDTITICRIVPASMEFSMATRMKCSK